MRTPAAVVTTAAFMALALTVTLPAVSQQMRWAGEQPKQPSSHSDALRGRWIALGGSIDQGGIACLPCHGLDGAGDTSGAFPRLSGQGEWYLYKSLQDYAAGLRPNAIMQSVARQLDNEEMLAVSSYYASSDAYPSVSRDADVEARQIGGAIAARGVPEQGVPACEGCHGQNGAGKPPIYPSLAGQYATYTELQLLLWKRGEREGDPQDIMELIAKAMTDEQIRAVSVFFESAGARVASERD